MWLTEPAATPSALMPLRTRSPRLSPSLRQPLAAPHRYHRRHACSGGPLSTGFAYRECGQHTGPRPTDFAAAGTASRNSRWHSRRQPTAGPASDAGVSGPPPGLQNGRSLASGSLRHFATGTRGHGPCAHLGPGGSAGSLFYLQPLRASGRLLHARAEKIMRPPRIDAPSGVPPQPSLATCCLPPSMFRSCEGCFHPGKLQVHILPRLQ